MIQFVCDACGKVDDIIYAATLEIPGPLPFVDEFVCDEYQLCRKCAAAALNPPALEVGKKYKAQDSHGNVGEAEIAEITVMRRKEMTDEKEFYNEWSEARYQQFLEDLNRDVSKSPFADSAFETISKAEFQEFEKGRYEAILTECYKADIDPDIVMKQAFLIESLQHQLEFAVSRQIGASVDDYLKLKRENDELRGQLQKIKEIMEIWE